MKKQQRSSQANASPNQAKSRSLVSLWTILGLCLFLAATVGTWAVFEFVLWNKLPSQFVGKWVIVGGEQDGATLDFSRNGTMAGQFRRQGRPDITDILDARVRVDGDTLYITTQNPMTRRDETKTQTIKTLTATNLVLVDDQGRVTKLERAD